LESQVGLKLTVIIPTLNSAAVIRETLASLAGVCEIIVVDGGSDDQTKEIASRHGARIVDAARGRGCQLAAGAAAATNEWLMFLHADTRMEPGWRSVVEAFAADPANRTRAASFRFKLEDGCKQARRLERMVEWRCRVLALPYGDQGLLIHRDFYVAIGGYPAWPLMEDVELVRRIGSRRLVMLPASAVTSAERWRNDGWLPRSLRNVFCLALFYAGVPPRMIARLYG
jgi:rSAM/selenodomain-associated transferase 2